MAAVQEKVLSKSQDVLSGEIDDVPVTIIQPSKGWISLNLRELWNYRELLYFLIWRDIKVR
jgi:lipopolysaccharide transport system permease protein